MLMELPDVDEVAVDTETSALHRDDGLKVACVTLAWEGGSLGLPFDQGIRDKLPVTQMDLFAEEEHNLGQEEWVYLLEWLGSKMLDFHNAKFDLRALEIGTRHWPGVDLVDNLNWDSMVAAKELDPTESVGLDNAARRAGYEGKISAEPIKAWLKKRKLDTKRYDLVPWSIIREYAVQDAEQTWGLKQSQAERFATGEGDWARYQRELSELLPTLYVMEDRGVGWDVELSLKAADKLEELAEIEEEKLPFAPDVNAAKRYFYDQVGLTPDRLTENGAPSLDAEQVALWVAEGVEFAAEYQLSSRYRRAVSMYYRGYPEKLGLDGRLRTNYKQCKVKSGRMSVDRVNLQAMPTERKDLEVVPMVRKLLRSAEGNELWSLDLQQAELRVAAQYSGCDRMLKMLLEGVDFHGDTTTNVLKETPGTDQWKAMRYVGKRLTFSSIFMVGGQTFQAELSKNAGIRLPLGECERMVADWRSLYPEFGVQYRRQEKIAARAGYVTLLPGTDFAAPSWFAAYDDHHKAWSRVVQGSLAEFFKLWMIDVERQIPGRMVLTVHDSILLDMPASEGESVAREVAEAGERRATELFGVEMPVDIERW